MPAPIQPEPLTYTLSITVCPGRATGQPHASAVVIVWQGDTQRAYVQLLECKRFEWPEDVAVTTLENYASTASAIVRRLLDEKLYQAVQEMSLHHVSAYQTPAGTDEPHH